MMDKVRRIILFLNKACTFPWFASIALLLLFHGFYEILNISFSISYCKLSLL